MFFFFRALPIDQKAKLKYRGILKSACQSVTFPLWACREIFNIDILAQKFFILTFLYVLSSIDQ